MYNTIRRICGEDTALCESILDLYKKVPSRTSYASVGNRFWSCVEMEHDSGRLGLILAEKGKMVPKGKMMRVAGALFRVYSGTASTNTIVSFNKSVGGDMPDRVTINIGPYVSKYLSEHNTGYNFNYNDLAYSILCCYKDELIKKIDEALQNSADKQELTDLSIDQIKRMYTTGA